MVRLLLIIAASYFIGCMFVDSIVVIMILAPIFHPIAMKLGIDPILIGVLVTMQAAIGAVTPPFGCNIFTAMAVFRRPYADVVRRITPFLALYILATLIVIFFPSLSLFLRTWPSGSAPCVGKHSRKGNPPEKPGKSGSPGIEIQGVVPNMKEGWKE
jgi:TRAP-type C4-dicarboxylate transport system permease large subunit